MSEIPGLLIHQQADGEQREALTIPSFNGEIIVPESHRFGNCNLLTHYKRLTRSSNLHGITIYGKCLDIRDDKMYGTKDFKLSFEDGIPPSALREINILSTMKHENIMNYHETIVSNNLAKNHLLFDYCVLSLEDLIKKKQDLMNLRPMMQYIMKQLFTGLQYLHENLVIHRNINCFNIFFTENGTVKIGGFQNARTHSKGNMTPGVTELMYRAPELLFGSKIYGPPVDIWSAGCVFARLILKHPLFTGNSELEVLVSIFDVLGIPSEDMWPGFDNLRKERFNGKMRINGDSFSKLKSIFHLHPEFLKVLQVLLLYYPNARPTAKQVLEDSAFFKDINEWSPEDMDLITKDLIAAINWVPPVPVKQETTEVNKELVKKKQ